MLSASTSLGAKRRAYEVAFSSNGELDPQYETIRPATSKEIKDM